MSLLSPHQAAALLEPWLAGRQIESIDLLGGGFLNRNFHLRLRGRPADVVLRIYDHNPAACAREVSVLGMVGRSLPVPRVLHADPEGEFGPPHAVLSMIEGISLFTLRSLHDEGAVAEAAFDAGRLLAKFSEYPGPPTPYETVLGLVERFSRAPLFAERAGAHLTERTVKFAEERQPRLDALGGDLCLVHGDYNSRNIFVKRENGRWIVSGILDWEFALSATPYCDIGNFLRYHSSESPRFEPHFSRGLREGGMSLPPDWLDVARLLDLPALCELLTRPTLPEENVPELVNLVRRTVGGD